MNEPAYTKLLPYDSGEVHLVFWCAPCNCRHHVRVKAAGGVVDATCWGWNGDKINPTITPSIKVEWRWGHKQEQRVCHSFVENGVIRYLDDCTHEERGRSHRLPLIDENPHDTYAE